MGEQERAVVISGRAETRLRAGYFWVFSGDVVNAHEVENGAIVQVRNRRGDLLGYALYSQHSNITLRWLTDRRACIDRAFWRQRLLAADAFRQQVVSDTDAFRLVFGESDLLPSLIIDRYGRCFVIQTLTPGMDALKSLWVDLLVELYQPSAVIERNDVKARQLEGLPLEKGILSGSAPENVEVTINGIRFRVDLLGGQKTGTFLDQRENYRAARRWARGRGLDGFCYTGGFALHLASSCQSVVAVDISTEALDQGKRNAALNGIEHIEFVKANVFDFLRDRVRAGDHFDIIVLDPPAFAKSRAALEGAIRGYKEINLRALRLLAPGGILVTCSCSYHLSESMFLDILRAAAADTHRRVRLLEKRTQARDHPILLSMPETHYLKCVILQVM